MAEPKAVAKARPKSRVKVKSKKAEEEAGDTAAAAGKTKPKIGLKPAKGASKGRAKAKPKAVAAKAPAKPKHRAATPAKPTRKAEPPASPLTRDKGERAKGLRGREAVRIFALASEQHRRGNLDEALRGYARTLALDPRFADVYNNMGVALRAQGKLDAAVAAYRRCLAMNPENPGVYSNMGNALREQGRVELAITAHERATKMAPGSPEAIYNLGLSYRDAGRLRDAMSCFDKTLDIKPDHVDCHWDRALTRLLLGDLEKGFEEYEWRWRLPHSPPRNYDQPRWNGAKPKGKRILVHQEQGFGDMIQFVRYIPMLAELGAEVIVECQPELVRLFSTVEGVSKAVIRGGPLPEFDTWTPMLTLPRFFGTKLDNIPADIPYLEPPELHSLHLPSPPGSGLKVGISWAGKPTHKNDVNRSTSLQDFLELTGLPGLNFFSLQKGERARELAEMACEPLIMDLGPKLQDFADTAAVISQLDLVITVDTAIGHLAGALGTKVWVAAPYAPDWRWMHERTDSPWYPSLRLFRQPRPGDWRSVFVAIRNALLEGSRSKARAGSST